MIDELGDPRRSDDKNNNNNNKEIKEDCNLFLEIILILFVVPNFKCVINAKNKVCMC